MRIISSQDLFESYMSKLDEAMAEGPRKEKITAKQWNPYVSGRDRAHAFNIAVRHDLPREKKSTGGKGARYASFGDRGAGNAARRRQGLAPLRGDTRKEEFELWVNSLVAEGYDLSDFTWSDMRELYEDYDLYIQLQEYLVSEGYTDTLEGADVIISSMSDEWLSNILDE